MAARTPHQNVTFPSTGGEAYGYLARPAGGRGPGVIVIQEWWGLTDHIRDVCDRLAAEGFVTLAPDLFGGWTAHDSAEAGEMMSRLPEAEAAELLAGAVDHLLADDGVVGDAVGAVGFCMGGGFVLALAAQQGERIGAAVAFYGVGEAVPDRYTGVRAAIQGHYGREDNAYPPDQAEALEEQIRRESGSDVEFFFYDAPHAFHNDENPMGNYRPEAAASAWGRTIDFLRTRLATRRADENRAR